MVGQELKSGKATLTGEHGSVPGSPSHSNFHAQYSRVPTEFSEKVSTMKIASIAREKMLNYTYFWPCDKQLEQRDRSFSGENQTVIRQ